MQGSKKICFATTLLVTAEAFMYKQIRLLNERGWQVSLACAPSVPSRSDILGFARFAPVRIERGMSPKGILRGMLDFYRLCRLEKFDMVMYATANAAFACSIAAWLARVPLRLYCQWGIRYVGFEGLKRMTFKLVEKLTCMFSTHIEPISSGNLEFGVSERLYPAGKAFVAGKGGTHGVDLSVFDISQKQRWRREVREACGIPESAVVYGFVGRITRDKGMNELFRAFKEIFEKTADVYLLLVGTVEEEEGLDAGLLSWTRHSSHVIWCGESNEVPGFISAMDIFVFPTYREGFGQVSIEAQAMEVAIVATDVPGPRDSTVPGESAVLVAPKDAGALEKAMLLLLEDAALRKRMGGNGRANVQENYDDRRFLPLLIQRREQLYGELVEGGRIA